MPRMAWPSDPMTVVQGFEKKHSHAEVGAFVMWAVWAVDALFYLDDLDAHTDKGNPPVQGHESTVLDMAHVRWATGTAITALDLCGAALARFYCGWKGARELDLRDFDPTATTRSKDFRGALSPPAIAWVDGVLGDLRYKNIHGARNPMTHSRLPRHFSIGDPAKSARTSFILTAGTTAISARALVVGAKELTSHHVASFLQLIEKA